MIKAMVPAALMAASISAPAFAQGTAAASGEQVFRTVCAACHMQDAKGGAGAATIPALAANAKLGTAAYPITIVLMGKGAMPGFSDLLKPAQIAGAITYVRTNFGNSYAKPVTEADVQAILATRPHR